MSHFSFLAKKIPDDGNLYLVHALDDYWGHHEYGYEVENVIYDGDAFDKHFERVHE